MQPLEELDAAFLALETPSWHFHMGMVAVMEPPPDARGRSLPLFDRIRSLIDYRIGLVPAFRQRALPVLFGFQHPVWVDDPEFDLDNHVESVTLRSCDEQSLIDLVAEQMSCPLDIERPLWKMTVVEGLPEGRIAVIGKLHHAILDGVSGASLFSAFLDLTPDDQQIPGAGPDSDWSPPPLPSTWELCKFGAAAVIRQPAVFARALGEAVNSITDVSNRNRRLSDSGEAPPPSMFSAPKTSINGSISADRTYASAGVSLDEVRLVGRTFGVSVNDVVLAVTSGALRRFFTSRREEAERLTAFVPISVREPERDGTLGNRLSAMLVSLAADIEDPVERLLAISRSAGSAKEQERFIGAPLLSNLAQLAFPVATSLASRCASELGLFDWLPPPFSVVVSNVPGPDVPLWWAGCPVVEVYPIGPVAAGAGLNFTTFSYRGKLFFGILGCRRLVPEIEPLVGFLHESMAELAERTASTVRAGES